MEPQDAQQSPYAAELKVEISKINGDDFVHAARLLTEESKRVESGDKYRNIPMLELHHDRPHSNAIKIRIPAKEYPRVNFSGKLLGPKGSTLKQLQQETGCKLSILGRGSMRDKNKEDELRKEGGKYAHLNEELHLLVECFAETVDAYARLSNAVTKIKEFMNPAADPQNLQEMMNASMEERGFFNGDGAVSHGGPGLRGAPAGRGLLGTPGGRGGPTRGGVSGPPLGRGGPPSRGAPSSRGVPPTRGAPNQRGAPVPRGAPPMRGSPSSGGRGAVGSRGTPVSRGGPISRGAAPTSRGRGLPPVSAPTRPPPVTTDYEDYGAETAYNQDPYGQSYSQDAYEEAAYGRRDPYAEEAYTEPAAAGGDTQYFDYGHGAQSYDEFEATRAVPPPSRVPATSAYDRGVMKASAPAMARSTRGTYRAHPYEATQPPRSGLPASRLSSGY